MTDNKPARVHPNAPGRPFRTRALSRLAITGIYLVRGVPRDLQRAARVRAVREGTTLRQVLVQALGDYAAGTWTPQRDHEWPRPAKGRAPERATAPVR